MLSGVPFSEVDLDDYKSDVWRLGKCIPIDSSLWAWFVCLAYLTLLGVLPGCEEG